MNTVTKGGGNRDQAEEHRGAPVDVDVKVQVRETAGSVGSGTDAPGRPGHAHHCHRAGRQADGRHRERAPLQQGARVERQEPAAQGALSPVTLTNRARAMGAGSGTRPTIGRTWGCVFDPRVLSDECALGFHETVCPTWRRCASSRLAVETYLFLTSLWASFTPSCSEPPVLMLSIFAMSAKSAYWIDVGCSLFHAIVLGEPWCATAHFSLSPPLLEFAALDMGTTRRYLNPLRRATLRFIT